MFIIRRMLIANRGEIAVRVIRTCQRLGIETVLAVAEADTDSVPARLADRTISLGPGGLAETYLSVEAVIGAAVAAGADAIHPGYGFLAAPQMLERAPAGSDGARGTQAPSIGAGGTHAPVDDARDAGGAGAGAGEAGPGLVPVRAPLPGTFYRAPRPGAAPFVEVGSRVDRDTVVGIVETMKLMNSVTAGVDGTVAEICLGNAEFAANGATLLRIRAD